jgi:hypothetical protein
MDTAFIVCKQPMPAFVVGTISKQVLSSVAAAAIPVLYYHAFVEFKSDRAGRRRRTSGRSH